MALSLIDRLRFVEGRLRGMSAFTRAALSGSSSSQEARQWASELLSQWLESADELARERIRRGDGTRTPARFHRLGMQVWGRVVRCCGEEFRMEMADHLQRKSLLLLNRVKEELAEE